MTSTKRKWLISGLILLLLAALAGWYFASPLYTLDRMRAAAEAGDSETLAGYVDFPALRQDLKADLSARIAEEAKDQPGGMGALGAALGAAMVGPVVDRFVSPEGLRAAFKARKDGAQGTQENAQGPVQVTEKPVIKRRGLSEFLVASKDDPNSGLVFTRHGLGWRLSGIEMPTKR